MFENVVSLNDSECFFKEVEKNLKGSKNLKGYYSAYKIKSDLGKFLTLYNNDKEIYIWFSDSERIKVIIDDKINLENNGYSQEQFEKAKSFSSKEYDLAVKYTAEVIKSFFNPKKGEFNYG